MTANPPALKKLLAQGGAVGVAIVFLYTQIADTRERMTRVETKIDLLLPDHLVTRVSTNKNTVHAREPIYIIRK